MHSAFDICFECAEMEDNSKICDERILEDDIPFPTTET